MKNLPDGYFYIKNVKISNKTTLEDIQDAFKGEYTESVHPEVSYIRNLDLNNVVIDNYTFVVNFLFDKSELVNVFFSLDETVHPKYTINQKYEVYCKYLSSLFGPPHIELEGSNCYVFDKVGASASFFDSATFVKETSGITITFYDEQLLLS